MPDAFRLASGIVGAKFLNGNKAGSWSKTGLFCPAVTNHFARLLKADFSPLIQKTAAPGRKESSPAKDTNWECDFRVSGVAKKRNRV
ncbi:hypothetical protein AGABI2DRAFT_138682 [Agaricus bisporus var. bisporus H97]|uniref:hypothetical protein n=1 Tax=Agaricus bisporus var. bisporus (strain H97 / ATCC MYA-4626 / FGSC 10389) TaxID=936046 RepID=UPI00029F5900|nr:hypothetical protein AGABI2DRAFT_138682 [Agaricus bisporus var. bisporus H97]EKV43437.1 hypothetical protein AGABI2DRAFT_138682 [Agaricus bisporus var. bisporus H97]